MRRGGQDEASIGVCINCSHESRITEQIEIQWCPFEALWTSFYVRFHMNVSIYDRSLLFDWKNRAPETLHKLNHGVKVMINDYVTISKGRS